MTRTTGWILLGGLVLTVMFVYLLGGILTPFIVGALLAYLGDPMVESLRRLKLNRTLAVFLFFVLVVLILILLLLLIVPALEKQVTLLLSQFPKWLEWIQQSIFPWMQDRWGIKPSLSLDDLKSLISTHWVQVGGFAKSIWKTMFNSGWSLVSWVINLVLIPVITFYLLRDWPSIMDSTRSLLPRRSESTFVARVLECDTVLSAFLRGQLSVMLVLALFYSVGLTMVGLQLSLLIGVVAGLISFVPYLGATLGVLFAVIAAVMQSHDMALVWWVLLVFGLGQLFESMVFTPFLVGDRIGLHPVAVIFAIMAGGELFGFVGVLLALPIAAVLMVLLRHALVSYRHSQWYGGSGGV